MRLADLMQTDVKTITDGRPAEEAWELMKLHGFHHLVVTQGTQVVGVISDGDLRNVRPQLRRELSVASLMNRDVVTAKPHTLVRDAANLMRGRAVGCLPVMEGADLVGIVTTTDLLELIARSGLDRSHLAPQVRQTARFPRANK